jgi:prepilin-type processing-associated H-X9-DG protein
MAYIGGSAYRNDPPSSYIDTALDSRLTDPGSTVMFADAAIPLPGGLVEYGFIEPPYFPTSEFPHGNADWGVANPTFHFRHNGRVNVIWCDGHVSSEKWEWAPDTNIYGGSNRRYAVGWFGPKSNYYFEAEKETLAQKQ